MSPVATHPTRCAIAIRTFPNCATASPAMVSNSASAKGRYASYSSAATVYPRSSVSRTTPRNVTTPPKPGARTRPSMARGSSAVSSIDIILRQPPAGSQARRLHATRGPVRSSFRLPQNARRALRITAESPRAIGSKPRIRAPRRQFRWNVVPRVTRAHARTQLPERSRAESLRFAGERVIVNRLCRTVPFAIAGDASDGMPDVRRRVSHRYAEAGPSQHRHVVARIADGKNAFRRHLQIGAQPLQRALLGGVGARDRAF